VRHARRDLPRAAARRAPAMPAQVARTGPTARPPAFRPHPLADPV